MSELSGEAVRLLVGMRELLQRGWCQRRSRFAVGYCLLGAKFEAMRQIGIPTEMPVGYEISHLLAEAIGCPNKIGIVDWNDESGRTQEDVLRLIDGILARARK